MKDNLVRILANNFDLSEGEATLYVALLKRQTSTVSELSKDTSINRTTVHGYVEKLIHLGLATQFRKGTRRKIVAESPRKLEELLDLQNEELLRKKESLPEFIDAVYKLIPNTDKTESLSSRYYEGTVGVNNVYKRITNSKAKEICSFINVNDVLKIFPDSHNMFKSYLERTSDARVSEIILGSEIPEDWESSIANLGKGYSHRLAQPEESLTDFDLLIFDDNVVLTHIRPISPFAIWIKSSAIAGGLRGVHQMLWKFLPK